MIQAERRSRQIVESQLPLKRLVVGKVFVDVPVVTPLLAAAAASGDGNGTDDRGAVTSPSMRGPVEERNGKRTMWPRRRPASARPAKSRLSANRRR